MSTLRNKTVLLDGRWLGVGGAGRATELLLRGLRGSPPAGRWLLWGPPPVRAFTWDGAEWLSGERPKRWWGQRDVLRVPECDVALYMHQIRPLRPGRSITLVLDTIPLRYAGPAPRVLKRAFLRAVSRVSSRIVTISEHSRQSIVQDLGASPDAITVVRFPVDRAMAARVRSLRGELPQRDVALYVGRFAPHKNLRALVAAFEGTRFRRAGGRLLLVGGAPDEVRELREFVRRGGYDGTDVEGTCSEEVLERAYATSRFLVMPSLEEGFGLPVWEAMACGLPVCVSDGGALPEITRGIATPFPARSTSAMAAALDVAAEQTPGRLAELRGPTEAEFAGVLVAEIERVVRGKV